jgi:hypothetical protein
MTDHDSRLLNAEEGFVPEARQASERKSVPPQQAPTEPPDKRGHVPEPRPPAKPSTPSTERRQGGHVPEPRPPSKPSTPSTERRQGGYVPEPRRPHER